MGIHKRVSIGLLIVLSTVVLAQPVFADRFTSTNYTIDASAVGNSFGGTQTSTNYNLVSSGGDSVIGNASGGSYKLGQGYVESLDKSLQLNVQPSGLRAQYTFDDSLDKTIYDSSANNLNISSTGTPTQTTGKLGNAIQVTDNNAGQVSSVPAWTTGNLTVEAWVKYDDWVQQDNSNAVARWDGTTTSGNWFLGRSGGQQFRFLININSTTYVLVGNTGKNAGQWYHIAGTYDGETARLYVDGVEEATDTTMSGALPDTSTPLSIGERANGTNPFWYGAVDEVKVFERTLSTSEITAEHSAQNAGIPSGLSLGTVTAGTSRTTDFTAITQTDAPGYGLYVHQNQNLTNGGNSIPGVSGSIASPVAWSEGTTKGLGFTLTSTNATAIPGTWGSGSNYAAFPGSSTLFYTRTGYTGGTKDVLNMRLRLDTAVTQAVGDYSNQVTITGTMTP